MQKFFDNCPEPKFYEHLLSQNASLTAHHLFWYYQEFRTKPFWTYFHVEVYAFGDRVDRIIPRDKLCRLFVFIDELTCKADGVASYETTACSCVDEASNFTGIEYYSHGAI